MINFANKHIDFVVACYAISAVLLVVLAVSIVYSARRNDRDLAMLESRREKRKSS